MRQAGDIAQAVRETRFLAMVAEVGGERITFTPELKKGRLVLSPGEGWDEILRRQLPVLTTSASWVEIGGLEVFLSAQKGCEWEIKDDFVIRLFCAFRRAGCHPQLVGYTDQLDKYHEVPDVAPYGELVPEYWHPGDIWVGRAGNVQIEADTLTRVPPGYESYRGDHGTTTFIWVRKRPGEAKTN